MTLSTDSPLASAEIVSRAQSATEMPLRKPGVEGGASPGVASNVKDNSGKIETDVDSLGSAEVWGKPGNVESYTDEHGGDYTDYTDDYADDYIVDYEYGGDLGKAALREVNRVVVHPAGGTELL